MQATTPKVADTQKDSTMTQAHAGAHTAAAADALQLQPHFFEPGKRYFRDFTAGDDFYETLIDTHRGLSDEQSALVNAKLILLLANHIGNMQVLRQAMQLARAEVAPQA